MNSIIPTIYLDMDEVVADFTGGVCDLFKLSRDTLETNRTIGRWDISHALTSALEREVTYEVIGAEIAKWGSKFWSNLAMLPTASLVISTVKEVDPNWCFLSTPWYHHGNHLPSTAGKIEWLHEKFGNDFDRYILTGKKRRCAHVGAILIDDRERNCQDFISGRQGVYSILMPHQGNSLGETYKTPELKLAYVAVQLNIVVDLISEL